MKMRWKVNLDFLLFFAYAIAFVDFAGSSVKVGSPFQVVMPNPSSARRLRATNQRHKIIPRMV